MVGHVEDISCPAGQSNVWLSLGRPACFVPIGLPLGNPPVALPGEYDRPSIL